MGGVLGALAGGGMLLLVGLLAGRFLMEMGWLSRDRAMRLGKCFLTVLGCALVYRLAGALCYFIFYGPTGDLTEYNMIFRSPGLVKMYGLLETPAWEGLLTGLFSHLGHFLGRLLFDQFLLGGEIAAFLCCFSGCALLLFRLQALLGEREGERLLFLFLCLPFSVFFFLPGWAPLLLLLGGLGFYFLGRLIPAGKPFLSDEAYGLLISLFSVLSAAVVYCLAVGKLM